jgi:hypothetical protein
MRANGMSFCRSLAGGTIDLMRPQNVFLTGAAPELVDMASADVVAGPWRDADHDDDDDARRKTDDTKGDDTESEGGTNAGV